MGVLEGGPPPTQSIWWRLRQNWLLKFILAPWASPWPRFLSWNLWSRVLCNFLPHFQTLKVNAHRAGPHRIDIFLQNLTLKSHLTPLTLILTPWVAPWPDFFGFLECQQVLPMNLRHFWIFQMSTHGGGPPQTRSFIWWQLSWALLQHVMGKGGKVMIITLQKKTLQSWYPGHLFFVPQLIITCHDKKGTIWGRPKLSKHVIPSLIITCHDKQGQSFGSNLNARFFFRFEVLANFWVFRPYHIITCHDKEGNNFLNPNLS